jgi:hypothetical protein
MNFILSWKVEANRVGFVVRRDKSAPLLFVGPYQLILRSFFFFLFHWLCLPKQVYVSVITHCP